MSRRTAIEEPACEISLQDWQSKLVHLQIWLNCNRARSILGSAWERRALYRGQNLKEFRSHGNLVRVGRESDLDLLVDFAPMAPYARVDAYFGLRHELRVLLGQEIDLVMVGAVKNPYVACNIERSKQLLYAA